MTWQESYEFLASRFPSDLTAARYVGCDAQTWRGWRNRQPSDENKGKIKHAARVLRTEHQQGMMALINAISFARSVRFEVDTLEQAQEEAEIFEEKVHRIVGRLREMQERYQDEPGAREAGMQKVAA